MKTASYNQSQPEGKKRKTWLWVLGWLCCFPVPLTIIMLRKKDLDPKIKYGVVAAAWLVYLALVLVPRGKSSENNITDTSSETASSQTTTSSDESTPNSNKQDTEEDKTETTTTTEEEAQAEDVSGEKIILIAGQENEYSKLRTLNEGTEFEETAVVFYIPSGTYEVTNIGNYRTQVNVYEGVTVNEDGWEEVANIGEIILLNKGEKGEITVPDGYYVDIFEPAEIELVRK